MSAIIDSLAAHRWTTVRTGAVVGTIHQRPTSGTAAGLREIATEQAQTLRAAFGGRPALTPRAEQARQRVIAHREASVAANTAPAPTATPRKSGRELFAEIDTKLADIPVGFYALPKREGATNGHQPFYYFKVHPFRDGKRIVQVTGGVGAFTEIRMKALWQLRAVEGILRDGVATAASLFGKETTVCGFCAANGRISPLTHERSRKAGYGQHCAEKHGLPW